MAFEKVSSKQYSEFIYLSRYSRWKTDLNRRETWEEVVRRLIDFWVVKYPWLDEYDQETDSSLANDLYNSIYNLDTMPSMRTLMTAGQALERDNVAGYNCAYTTVKGRGKELSILTDEMQDLGFDEPIKIQLKNPIAFDEIFYILLCGTGVGFSVERQYINQLPTIGKPLNSSIYHRNNKNYHGVPKDELSHIDRKTNTVIVEDSKYGWASALRIFIVELYNGNFSIKRDVSKVRPAGSVLKTFGGRASGPDPLEELFNFCINTFKQANGRKLNSIEVHSVVCKIADIVVVGGVRRSALISLSNLSDDRMRHAKSGDWWITDPHFKLANNSSAYTEKPSPEVFLREWLSLIESKSGERGIFNREAARRQATRSGRRKDYPDFGINPCSEIIERDQQFCNLSEVVVRPDDKYQDLVRKVKVATILGTLQSTLTNFKYLNPKWKENTEEERLLGVSLTGIMDHIALSNRAFIGMQDWDSFYSLGELLEALKNEVIKTNEVFSNRLGINRSAAATCGKPSGTVSQLVDSSSGCHARHSLYVLRAVRNDIKDPISKFMQAKAFPYETDVTDKNGLVFYFPLKSPETSVLRTEMSAIEQLELHNIYVKHWAEHTVSITVSVAEDEWLDVGAWVYEHFDESVGISFLPKYDHVYKQAPYQEITKEEYETWVSKMPTNVNWTELGAFEKEDMTKGSQEYACAGGQCDLV